MSLRRGFGWNFVGMTSYNLSQLALLVVLARLTDKAVVGQFSLTMAIAAPVFLTVGLNVRTLQAVDASGRWGMCEFMSLRHVLDAVAVALIIAVGLAAGVRGEGLVVLAVVAIAKCAEAVSQTYYGFLQKHERLDLVARSLILRSITGPVLFYVGVVLSGRLVFGCAGLLIGWLIPQWLLDRPSARAVSAQTGASLGKGERTDWTAVRQMAWRGLPLGVDAGLSSLAINVPRYAIQVVLGAASLGLYAALAYLAQTVQMITSSLSGALVTRLSVYHHQQRRREFTRLLGGLTAFGVCVIAVAVVATAALGGPFVRLTLGAEYVDQPLLMALVVSAGFITMQRSLCKGLEASWRFRSYVVVDVVTTVSIVALTPWLLDVWGLVGAAVAVSCGFALGTLVVFAVLVDVIRSLPARPPTTAEAPHQLNVAADVQAPLVGARTDVSDLS